MFAYFIRSGGHWFMFFIALFLLYTIVGIYVAFRMDKRLQALGYYRAQAMFSDWAMLPVSNLILLGLAALVTLYAYGKFILSRVFTVDNKPAPSVSAMFAKMVGDVA